MVGWAVLQEAFQQGWERKLCNNEIDLGEGVLQQRIWKEVKEVGTEIHPNSLNELVDLLARVSITHGGGIDSLKWNNYV